MSDRKTDRPPTSDRLREDITHGKAGDKTDFPDPAAAPLGTDAEAGGHPPTREELEIARRGEIGGRKKEDDPPTHGGRPNSAADPD